MARMIPSVFDDRTPPGERDVFAMLAAGPDEWTALHSLDLAPYNRHLRTEIDFLVIVPDTGIVCIEVKSHQEIRFTDDRWHPASISRSPFKQAADGSFAFHRRISEIAPSFRALPVVHLCIFPNASFSVPAHLSVTPWELMDSRRFRSFNDAPQFCSDVRAMMQRAIKEDANLHPLQNRLSESQIESLVALCVPVQKSRPDKRAEIAERERAAEMALREQQRPVLQLAAFNKHLVVSGPAGTGKTLIALELARRFAADGKRTALLCFNALIGDWLHHKVGEATPKLPLLVAGRAFKILAEMCDISIPADASTAFWEELPALLEERVTDPDFRARATFDCIVVDEAQDVLARPSLWQALSTFLEGGIEGGSYVLLGDFENQVLSGRDELRRTLAELGDRTHPTRWVLSENCRNYPVVGNTAVALSGLNPTIYSGYRRSGGHLANYDVHFYKDQADQAEALRKLLSDFKQQGFRPSEVTVLSFCAPDRSAAESLRKTGFPLRPLWKAGPETAFGSVHAFKGMENKNIILTDVRLTDAEFHRSLFYVGMTRATESVRVLCDFTSAKTLAEWLSKGDKNA